MRLLYFLGTFFSISNSLTVKRYCDQILQHGETDADVEKMIFDWCETFIEIKHGLKAALNNHEVVEQFMGLQLGGTDSQRSGGGRMASMSGVPVLQLLKDFSSEVKTQRESRDERRKRRRKERDQRRREHSSSVDEKQPANTKTDQAIPQKEDHKMGKMAGQPSASTVTQSTSSIYKLLSNTSSEEDDRPEQPDGREKECYKLRNGKWRCPCNKRRNRWRCKSSSSFARRG